MYRKKLLFTERNPSIPSRVQPRATMHRWSLMSPCSGRRCWFSRSEANDGYRSCTVRRTVVFSACPLLCLSEQCCWIFRPSSSSTTTSATTLRRTEWRFRFVLRNCVLWPHWRRSILQVRPTALRLQSAYALYRLISRMIAVSIGPNLSILSELTSPASKNVVRWNPFAQRWLLWLEPPLNSWYSGAS